jgi:hypothetical protein
VRFVEADREAARELGLSFAIRSTTTGRGITTGAFRPPAAGGNGEFTNTYNENLPSGSSPFGTLVATFLGAGLQADVLI